MRWGGVLIALFVVFHLLHLTTGTVHPAPFSKEDVYTNVVVGFRVGWIVVLYLVAMAVVGSHRYHGGWAWKTSG